ncbi:hypothetical protein WJX79_008308 [Trebouxia sp. C0005]
MDQRILEARDLEGVLLIRDKLDLSAAFLIPHLLQLALTANLRIVLLLVQDSLSHYQQALRKLGINLTNCIASQQVIPVTITSSLTSADFPKILVQQLASACTEACQALTASGVCVLIDSLSALAGLTDDQEQWQAFLHYCHSLKTVTQGQYACVMVTHEDVEDDAHWISWLRHSAQVEIEVRALESGASQDISGQVLVTRREAYWPTSAAQTSKLSSHELDRQHDHAGSIGLQESRKVFCKLGPNDIRFFG